MKKLFFLYAAALVLCAAATAGLTALLLNIQQHKFEARDKFLQIVQLTEKTIDPSQWGLNFPREYGGYLLTAETNRTRYGGSEAFSKLEQRPALRRIFAGYAFAVDYRKSRGHYFSLTDQKLTDRTHKFKQPGACLQCHAGGLKEIYEEQGGGNLQAGFEKVCGMTLSNAWGLVTHPIACIDCHDPKTMALRVTRPGFLNAIRRLKAKEGIADYDPNTMASRQEMRTFVCGQCHVEYYFKGDGKVVTYPWDNGLKVEQIEKYYDDAGWSDWTHAETGAKVLKAQHPEFETWNQGIHARSGVACADCHMPYVREGAMKISDHHIRSPLLNVSRACLPCHHFPEAEMKARAEAIQTRTLDLMDRSQEALVGLIDDLAAARAAGASDAQIEAARKLQRRAQWRFDFVNAENSTGFHAPQETARILAECIDFARQGQLALRPERKGAAPPAP